MTRRWVILVVAVSLAMALGVSLILVRNGDDDAADPQREGATSSSSTRSGWQVIEFEGVKVDIPDDWRRADRGGCPYSFEHWAPDSAPPCSDLVGVSFYGSATFDPMFGPGLRSQRETRGLSAAAWSGYAYAGRLAVYVAASDRRTARLVLASARAAG